MRLAFRPGQWLASGFSTSIGPDLELPLVVSTWSGRALGHGDGGPRATLTVAGSAVVLHVDDPAGAIHVRRDPHSDTFRAGREQLPDGVALLAEAGPANTVPGTLFDRIARSTGLAACALEAPAKDGSPRIATTTLPPGVQHAFDPELTSTARLVPDPLDPGMIPATAAGEDVTPLDDEDVIPFGPAYDASLRDLMLLFVLDRKTTGADTSSEALTARTAEYINLAGVVAATYEEQLGLRLRLQEIILHPDADEFVDPGQDLWAFLDWTEAHRPFSDYRWSHAARFGIVSDTPGGIIGRAFLGFAGTPYGLSENETSFGFTLFAHELGHSVGAEHTTGGVMNAFLIGNQRNFFRLAEGRNVTAAKQISDTMREPSLSFGTAAVRDGAEIPFGRDDFIETGVNAPVTFHPLANDFAAVPSGAVNELRMVEAGAVFPRHAGTAAVDANTITFSPAPDFTGIAWFSYTLGGDVGNAGRGWLHRADVQVTVAGDGSLPARPPTLNVANHTRLYDPALAAVTFNPMLADTGSGFRWAGDVSRLLGSSANDLPLGGTSLALTTAAIVDGPGTLGLVALPMAANSTPVLRPAGDLVYTPPPGGTPLPAIVEYTIRDATGAMATATVTLVPGSFVNVFALEPAREEDASPGWFSIRTTQPLNEPAIVAFRLAGDALADTHFTVSGATDFDPLTASGSVLIPAGESRADLFIHPIADGMPGPDRTAVLRLDGLDPAWNADPPGAFAVATLPVLDRDRPASFTQIFPGGPHPFALAHRQLAFLPDRLRGYLSFIEPDPVDAFPVDPAGGSILGMGDDAATLVGFTDGRTFPFAGQAHSNVWVGSNGYVTFGQPDTFMIESPEHHFSVPRIAVLFDDLDPSAGGTVSHRQLPDRWVLTFEDVPEWSLPNRNSWQLELFWDGTIRMTWLQVDTGEALVGLSDGTGVPDPFHEDNFLWARPGSGVTGLPASVESWRELVFAGLPGGATDPLAVDDADPDNDGLPNLLEYAFRLNPLDPASRTDDVLSLAVHDGDLLTLRFRRQLGVGSGDPLTAYTVNDLTYRVEVSEDLVSWHSGPDYLELAGPSTVNGDGTETVEIRSRTPVSVAPQYLRLRVNRTGP